MSGRHHLPLAIHYIKPLSVTTNVVDLQTDDAGHVDQNSSAHVARVVGLQTDAVVVTEARIRHLQLTTHQCIQGYLRKAFC